MKLTEEQIKAIKLVWGDWESVHGIYDSYVMARLKELDPEFYESLGEAVRGATFWYA